MWFTSVVAFPSTIYENGQKRTFWHHASILKLLWSNANFLRVIPYVKLIMYSGKMENIYENVKIILYNVTLEQRWNYKSII